MMKRKRSREETIEELRRSDANFRRLYDKVVEMNGGRVPSSEEIDQHIDEWRARHRESS